MNESKKIMFTLIAFIFLIAIAFAVSAQETSPQLPHLFYGAAKVDSTDLPSGSVIIAKVSNAEKGRITTTSAGKYGGKSQNQDKLVVQNVTDDSTIEFFVSRVKANQTASFDSLKIQELNLSWVFPAEIEFDGELFNEPYTCIPGTDIEVNLNGLTGKIDCDNSSSGTINNISTIDKPTTGAFSVFPANLTSTIYEISISGDEDIIVTITYNDAGIDESTITIYKFNGVAWVPIPSSDIVSIDTAANKITFIVHPGGTPFGVFGSLPAPPAPTGAAAAVAGGGGGGGGGGVPYPKPTPVPTPTAPPSEEPEEEEEAPTPTAPTITTTAGAPTAPPAPTGLAALTGAVISGLTTPGGIITALIVLILVGTAGYYGYYYLYRRR